MPPRCEFSPVGNDDIEKTDKKTVILNVDEYETIRLIDKQGFSQEQCAEYMYAGSQYNCTVNL